MDNAGNPFYRKKDTQRPSILQALACPDADYDEYKIKLPPRMDIISQQNQVYAYVRSLPIAGYTLLPLYNHETSRDTKQRTYSLGINDILALKWGDYQQNYPKSLEKPVIPKAKDVRFANQKVICPGCRDNLCGKRMVAGPTLDDSGPVPIPADVLNRFRNKLTIAKANRTRKPFK